MPDVYFKRARYDYESLKPAIYAMIDAIGLPEINLAKLKTHAMMTLTLGVKNLFGCIVGLRKPEWHVRAGVNRQIFANLILKISEAVNPSLTIIDGILSMEGQGPGKGGKPKETGIIIGSSNTLAADMAVCRMLDIPPRRIPTLKAALDAGICPNEITIHGDFKKISPFELPNQASFSFGPKILHAFIRRHLVQRPVVEEEKCILCGECWKFCPVNAISEDKVIFDYNACIRCYCCIEVCPKGALASKDPLPGKLIRQVRALYKKRKQ